MCKKNKLILIQRLEKIWLVKLTSRFIKLLPSFAIYLFLGLSSVAIANPEGGQVVGGSATIVVEGSTTTINQSSDKAIIDWRTFNIQQGEKTQFNQPSSSSMILNRVIDNSQASQIHGQLHANGHVVIVNQAGIVFGPTAQVDVGGLIATTANIRNEDFMAGKLIFSQLPDSGGAIINKGTITAAEGGLVALVAPGVVNQGVIKARMGKIALASGTAYTVDLYGDQLINFSVGGTVTKAANDENGNPMKNAESNTGELLADGGRIEISAKIAKGVVDNVINMEGVAQARSVSVSKSGVISLHGGSEGIVKVTGKVDTSGRTLGYQGGKIKVTGEKVGITGQALLDASGDVGGGEILLGGNFQGKGPLYNASYAYFGPGAIANADAITNGDGGTVILWSDYGTKFYGFISAQGGVEGGDGGLAETSGKQLVFEGNANLTAANGSGGLLLLDPIDITIIEGTSSEGTYQSGDFSSGTLSFSTDASGSGTVTEGTLRALGNVNITLQAKRDIILDTDVALDLSTITTNTNTFKLQAGDNTTAGAGDITFNSGSSITTGGGSVNIVAGDATQGIGSASLRAITVSGSGTIAVTAQDDITINGALASADAGITLTANDAITLNSSVTASNSSVTIKANQDGSGSSGLTVASGGSVSSTNAAVDIDVNTSGGGTGGVSIAGDISSTSAGLSIETNNGSNSTGGSITRTAGTVSVSSGQTLTLSVPSGSSSSIGTSGAPIITSNSNGTITLTAGTSGAFISNTGSFTLGAPTLGTDAALSAISDGTLTPPSGALSLDGGNITLKSTGGSLSTQNTITTTSGNITLEASSGLTIGHALTTTSGTISLTTTGGDLSQNAGGDLASTSGNIVISGDDAVSLNDTVDPGSGTIAISANTDGAGANNLNLNTGLSTTSTSTSAISLTLNTSSGGTGTLSVNNALTANTGDGGGIAINLNAAALTVNAAITAKKGVTLTANNYTISSTIDGD